MRSSGESVAKLEQRVETSSHDVNVIDVHKLDLAVWIIHFVSSVLCAVCDGVCTRSRVDQIQKMVLRDLLRRHNVGASNQICYLLVCLTLA